MKYSTSILLATAISLIVGTSVQAQTLLDSYIARIGPDDHFNSRGVRLQSVAAIIRQDRANFHKFRIRDAEDEHDSYFGSKANRGRMERMLNNGSSTGSARRAILDHEPLIRVKIYSDAVVVTIIQ